MKIGDIDVVEALLHYEMRIAVLEKALDFITSKNSRTITLPTAQDVIKFRNMSIEEIKKKYPNMGIEKKDL